MISAKTEGCNFVRSDEREDFFGVLSGEEWNWGELDIHYCVSCDDERMSWE